MTTLRNATILYVDDDPDDREFLSDAIREADPHVRVVTAENGVEALEYLESVKKEADILPCVVVLDLNMPYLDGRQTFEEIRKDPALDDIFIIIFTSSENPNDKSMFRQAGAEFISKPYNINYMNRIASHMLEHCH